MNRLLFFVHLLLCGLVAAAQPELVQHDSQFVPDHVLRVDSRNMSIACTWRLSAVVNGSFPGPELRIPSGKRTWIRVYNDMKHENLTMHWHGLAQRMAVFSDGSPQGSQWPIPPGHFFDYELQTTIEDAGTHFYHSHVGMQALTVAGSLVVEDCGPTPYHFDDERTLLWSDLFTETDQQMEADLTSVQFAWPGETRALLLNGQGISRRSEGSLQSPYPNCSLPVIDVDPGKQYRFRFIGATGLSLVSMAFEGHSNLSVVQVDGDQWTQPAPVDRIQVASGQRFDVLFPAKTEKQLADEGRTTYFLQFETRARPEIFRGYAVLRYRKSAPLPAFPDEPPVRIPLSTADWLEYQLQPLHPEPDGHPRLSEVTRRVTINSTQLIDPQSGLLMWRLADQSWTENAPVPLLVDIYKRGAKAIPDFKAAMANHGWDPTTRAFPAKVGEVLEIVLQNTGSLVDRSGQLDVHPFHAHGEHYYDVGSGPGLYDAEANEAKIVSLGYQPVRRDTTMLYRYSQVTEPGHPAGWRAWRVRVSQPGVWLVHCHTLQHMVMGMQSVWVIGNASEILKIPPPYIRGYLDYGGSAYGNRTHNPVCVQQFGPENSCPAAPPHARR